MFTSGIPPAFELITGVDAAIASNAASPKLSCSEGRRKTSDSSKILYKSFTFPINRILSISSGFSSKNSVITSISGPSPIMINLDLIFL